MARYVTSALKTFREQLAPVRKESAFLERGVLTPEEFVAAGDQLVFRCPTWTWEAGDPKKRRDFLPADKQYLVTRNVPCHRRASTFERDYVEETEVEEGEGGEGEDGWLATHMVSEAEWGGGKAGGGRDGDDEFETIGGAATSSSQGASSTEVRPLIRVMDEHFKIEGGGKQPQQQGATTNDGGKGEELIGGGGAASSGQKQPQASGGDDDDEYADIATFEDDNLEQNDEATLQQPLSYLRAEEPAEAILATRTYDISITYDKYYQTPKAFLFGYDEHRRILDQEQVFEDVMQDYAQRTVTFEKHPHLDEMHASIHPCQHAKVMSRIVENLQIGGTVPRIDQYLFIFLKFVQSVIPTIEYDYTMEIQAGGVAPPSSS